MCAAGRYNAAQEGLEMGTSRPQLPEVVREMKWSPAEKSAARRAFERALDRELSDVIHEAKQRAAKVAEPADLWSLERWLTRRRQQIDREYDFRYSVLPFVFAQLLRDGRLSESDFHGLGQEKMDMINKIAQF